ncbi:uncharacterized protein LOC143284266 [Babylonia areolata]|uniref:uncharacterized protein LOC143284266 n=1 Tax=Babylonia areolata TaxID=304850 RepID=UPI003FD1A39C
MGSGVTGQGSGVTGQGSTDGNVQDTGVRGGASELTSCDGASKRSSDSQHSAPDLNIHRTLDVHSSESTHVSTEQSTDVNVKILGRCEGQEPGNLSKEECEGGGGGGGQQWRAPPVGVEGEADRGQHPPDTEPQQDAIGSQAVSDPHGNSASQDSYHSPSTSSDSNRDSTSTAASQSSQAERDANSAPCPDAPVERSRALVDASCSSGEGGQGARRMESDNWVPFSLPPHCYDRQYTMRQSSPHVFVHNRAMGHLANRESRGDEGFGHGFQTVYPSCHQNRWREHQQGTYVYGTGRCINGRGYPCMGSVSSGHSNGRPRTPRTWRGRGAVVNRPWPRRGRDGVMTSGRGGGGFNAGRGGRGMFSQARIPDSRFSYSPNFPRRRRSRSYGGQVRRRSQDGKWRGDQEQVYQTRNRDGAHWDTQDNGYSRGRTPFRTKAKQTAYRHRSAPPAHGMSMADGAPHLPRPRPRSLSRGPHHSHWQASSQQSPRHNRWNYSPGSYRSGYSQQEPRTPRRNFGPDLYRLSRDVYPAWVDRREVGNGVERQDRGSSRNGQGDVTYINQQNDGFLQRQTDCELLSWQGASEQRACQQTGPDTFQHIAPEVTQVVRQETGSDNSQQLELESVKTSQLDVTSTQGTDHPQTASLPDGSQGPLQEDQAVMDRSSDGQYGADQYRTQQQETYQLHQLQQGRSQREATQNADTCGSLTAKWSGQQYPSQQRNGPPTPNQFQQQAHRQLTGSQQQQDQAAVVQRSVESAQRPDTAVVSKGVVTRWQHNIPYDIPLWTDLIAAQGSGSSAVTQQGSVRISGSPPLPAGDDLGADVLWKMMQLQVLHEQQHVDQLEAGHILKAIMGMHFPADASQNLNALLMSHQADSFTRGSGRQEIRQSNTAHSSSGRNHQQKCLLGVGQRGNYGGFDDKTNNNQNGAYQIVPHKNRVNQPGHSVRYGSPSRNQNMLHTNWHEKPKVFYGNVPQNKYGQRGGFQGNRRSSHTREKQQWQNKETRSQYVYYLGNRQQRNEKPEQQAGHETNQNQYWNRQNMNQFSNGNRMSARQSRLFAADHGHEVRSSLSQNGNGFETRRLNTGRGQRSPSALRSWQNGQTRANMKQGLEPQADVDKSFMEVRDGQVNCAKAPGTLPAGYDTAGQQHAADGNGNVVPVQNGSDGRPQLQLVSNTGQPISMSMGNFVPSGTPLQTPLMPVHIQPGPMNTPLLQPVNTPLYHPLQTPFMQTVNGPYPQQNVFQFPSPVPLFPMGNVVGATPNIFQFPDPGAGQQPAGVSMVPQSQQDGAPQTPLDNKPYGFAGNHPLVQFPPATPANCLPSDNCQPLAAGDINGNAV